MITIPSAIASLLPFRLGLIKSGPLTNRETEKLDAFLLSDGGLENAMDISTLNGFLCAVLSGLNVIMPSEWMRWVWDMEEGEQAPVFASGRNSERKTRRARCQRSNASQIAACSGRVRFTHFIGEKVAQTLGSGNRFSLTTRYRLRGGLHFPLES